MTKNSNFKHRNICTLGGELFKLFLDAMEEQGWRGRNDYSGSYLNTYYRIDSDGFLSATDNAIGAYVSDREFIEHYSPMLIPDASPIKKEEKMYTVTRAEFKRIHDVACAKWKKTLTDWCNEQTFDELLRFSGNVIKSMLAASNESQKQVILSVFDKYEEKLDLSKMSFKGDVFDDYGTHALIAIKTDTNNSFILNNEYTWDITNEGGRQILTPTRK
jgi:hypothetical protein